MAEEVESLLSDVTPPERQADARALLGVMARVSGEAPARWGSMIGFGRYRYRYESGREGEAFRIGFAPRKSELVLYLMDGFADRDALLARLGKHRTGKSCLYVKRLGDVDETALEDLLAASWQYMTEKHPT